MILNKVTRIGVLGALAIIGMMSAGCSQGVQTGKDGRLLPQANPYARDIPVPMGFRMVEDACEDQLTGTRRLYLRHTYEGRSRDKLAVRSFYEEQMPRARWTLVSNRNVKGTFALRFEKGGEACTITIRDAGRSLSANTQIEAVVVQEERGTSPGEPRTRQ
ncbi:MAG: hypothetical protein JXB13_22035 [Phycisphaerae bacterium]|nr:hypothetical protein [Phycisphaerae bacterium]